MNRKKKILYVFSILLLGSAAIMFAYPSLFFGTSSRDPWAELAFILLKRFFSFAVGLIGLALLFLALVQKNGGTDAGSGRGSNVFYKTMNPYMLMAMGILFFVVAHFDIGFNYTGAKSIIYIGSGLIFAFGLGGLLRGTMRSPE